MAEAVQGSTTVVIVGLHPSNWQRALEEPPGVEMWSLNQGHAVFSPELMGRMTRWFQLHPWLAMAHRQRPELGHLEFLQSCPVPVYLEEAHPEVPASVRYPYEAVCQTIGSNYFATNSFCYMVALAIHEGFQKIHLHGVDMAPNDRSDGYARPCMEFLLGFAAGRGIEVQVPPDSPLLRGDLYARSVLVPSSMVEVAYDALSQAGKGLAQAADLMVELQRQAFQGKAAHRPPAADGHQNPQGTGDGGWIGVLRQAIPRPVAQSRDGSAVKEGDYSVG